MSLIFFLSLFFCSYASIAAGQHDGAKTAQTYIVHVRRTPGSAKFASFAEKAQWYKSFLPVGDRLIYSYGDVVSGFAAKLTDEELAVVTKKVGFGPPRPHIVSPHYAHSELLGAHKRRPRLLERCKLWPRSDRRSAGHRNFAEAPLFQRQRNAAAASQMERPVRVQCIGLQQQAHRHKSFPPWPR